MAGRRAVLTPWIHPVKTAATLSLPVRSLEMFLDEHGSPLRLPRIHPDAASHIFELAKESPSENGYRIEISAPEEPAAAKVPEAVRAHFTEKARQAERALTDHVRKGVKALVISLLVVAALFAGAESLHALGERRLYRLLSESLVIIAWVTMWIPVESLLFENLSLRRKRNRLRALSKAEVKVLPSA